jgi:hypothetical protein
MGRLQPISFQTPLFMDCNQIWIIFICIAHEEGGKGNMHICPVCGYNKLEFPPKDFTICPSCGTEFGYQDATVSHSVLRQRWISKGMLWHSRVVDQPLFWDANQQLLRANLTFDIPWLKNVKFEVEKTLTSVDTGIEREQLVA